MKPVIYVLELIFGMVVTFGTADKFVKIQSTELKCMLNPRRNEIGKCIIVIILGLIAITILLITLRKRLIAAFDVDYKFTHSLEAQLCVLASIIWLIIASLVTSSIRIVANDNLNGEKIVTIIFSWILVIFCLASGAIAWLVLEGDEIGGGIGGHTGGMPQQKQDSNSTTSQTPDTSDLQLLTPLHRSVDELESESSRLWRKNAARDRDEPDTSVINSKLSEWERVIEGTPPKDQHAVALASAERLPLSNVPTKLGLRRRVTVDSAAIQSTRRASESAEDEITPIQAISRKLD